MIKVIRVFKIFQGIREELLSFFWSSQVRRDYRKGAAGGQKICLILPPWGKNRTERQATETSEHEVHHPGWHPGCSEPARTSLAIWTTAFCWSSSWSFCLLPSKWCKSCSWCVAHLHWILEVMPAPSVHSSHREREPICSSAPQCLSRTLKFIPHIHNY